MSAYIQIKVKVADNKFLPLFCFSRSNVEYEALEDYVASYSQARPLTKAIVNSAMTANRENRESYGATRQRIIDRIASIERMNNSVEEKTQAIWEEQNSLDELEEIRAELEKANQWLRNLYLILDEAEDTKYYSDESRHIDPNDYLYAGIECAFGTESEEEE